MAGQQRVYKQKISSAQGMQKIFKAMEMISAARITRAQARVTATTPYAQAITRAVGGVAAHSADAEHPYLAEDRTSSNRVAILLYTADRGMAGSYSSNVIREAEGLIDRLASSGKTPVLYVVGRKGLSYFSFRDRPVEKAWTPYDENDLVGLGSEISDTIQAGLAAEDDAEHLDELFVVYTRFKSRFTQEARISRLVPLEVDESVTAPREGTYPLYEFQPSASGVLDALLPRYVESRITNFLIQSVASEHANRQRAMSTAADNADTQIKKYTRLANAARQADITQEITEIVGGVEALKAGSGPN